jgi:hypothetical protein
LYSVQRPYSFFLGGWRLFAFGVLVLWERLAVFAGRSAAEVFFDGRHWLVARNGKKGGWYGRSVVASDVYGDPRVCRSRRRCGGFLGIGRRGRLNCLARAAALRDEFTGASSDAASRAAVALIAACLLDDGTAAVVDDDWC